MTDKATVNSRNCSIDIFRILFSVYVVALHSVPAQLDAYPLFSLAILPLFRFSVPYFLMVSGYYFFRNYNEKTSVYASAKKIVKIYLFWSCLYFAIKFISWGYKSPVGFIVDCVYSFFVLGSYYHLWYFPALIFAVCVSGLFYKHGHKKMLFFVSVGAYLLCLLISEYGLCSFIPENYLSWIIEGISILQPLTIGLFYFCCGQLINVFYNKYKSKNNHRVLTYVLPISVILWFALIWCDFYFSLGWELLIILGIYFNVGLVVLVLLLNPLPQYCSVARKSRYLANFAYYSHPIFAWLLGCVSQNFVAFSDFLNFPITIALVIIVGMILYRINSKGINRFIG